MKRHLGRLSLILFCTGLACPVNAQSAAGVDPAAALAGIKAVASAPMTLANDPVMRRAPREELLALVAASSELVVPLVEKMLRDHPTATERWEAIRVLAQVRRNFTGEDAAERRTEWMRRRGELIGLALNAPDAPDEIAGAIAVTEVMVALQTEAGADLPRAQSALTVLRARQPAAPMRPMVERMHLAEWHKVDPGSAVAFARVLSADRHADVAQTARHWLASVEFRTKSLSLKFPDLDGREIDLSQYRGKVVLLDFWATWCAPCMADMPKLRALYGKYHTKGLEIIGITDDIPARDPDSPRGSEKTVESLKAFLVQHDMPWPQLWDTRTQGMGPKGLLQQFGVRSLPTYLLFDRDGMFVTEDLRGDKLEAEVKRLLGL